MYETFLPTLSHKVCELVRHTIKTDIITIIGKNLYIYMN